MHLKVADMVIPCGGARTMTLYEDEDLRYPAGEIGFECIECIAF